MDDLIYLDNAATTWPKPDSVYEFMTEFCRNHGVNPGRSGFDKAINAGDMVERTRERLCAFFNGDSAERLIFAYNATDALNLLINGVVEEGDHVISTNLEHNSVIRPLNHLEHRGVAEIDYVPFNSEGFMEADDIAAAFRPNTKLVIINHCSNVIGTIQDLESIGRVVKGKGALFAVDVSQTAGVVPVDMKKMNIDVVAFTGHKALMGPTGTGGLCIRDGVEIAITRSGGTGVRSAHPLHLEEYPYRMEAGTLNLLGIAGLWAGQEWIEKKGMNNIYEHEMSLASSFVEGVSGIEGVNLHCCECLDNHLSTISVNVENVEAMDTGIMLDVDHDIATRTGLHCAPKVHEQIGTAGLHGTVRFSIGAFNTIEHMQAALKALREIAGWSRSKRGK